MEICYIMLGCELRLYYEQRYDSPFNVIKLRMTPENLFVMSPKYDVLHRIKFTENYLKNLYAAKRSNVESIELRGEILSQLNKLNNDNQRNDLEFDQFEMK